ncbi:MAG: head-tail adaptor protein [Alphaproteobacteria bacterium]|nr:MAG: head-tail adaptor protein [Alphaproteobacteria bacterium]
MRGAPRLNHLVTLEAPISTPDGAGGRIAGWVVRGSLRAAIEERSETRRGADGVAVVRTRSVFTIRAAPPGAPSRPEPGQRLRMAGRVWRIRAVRPHRAWAALLECIAEEEYPA